MSILLHNIEEIAELTLPIVQAMMQREDDARRVTGDDAAPLDLTKALADFFQIAASVESGDTQLEQDEISEFAAYGLGLLERLAYLVRHLELMDHRESMARVGPSLALWFARREASLDNLSTAADSFAWLVNSLNDKDELAEMCRMMEEVISAVPESLRLDENRDDPWRPWRVINLNSGIAATRSLDAELMEQTFERLGQRLPYDMPGFLTDGKRQMMVSNVPDDVEAVMNRFIERWPPSAPH